MLTRAANSFIERRPSACSSSRIRRSTASRAATCLAEVRVTTTTLDDTPNLAPQSGQNVETSTPRLDEHDAPAQHRSMAASVVLDHDHPGFADPAYRARRDTIAAVSAGYRAGGPIPTIDYTPAEHDV